MGAPMMQETAGDVIVNIPPAPDRLDKILDYLSNAPVEVQIVSIIVFGLLVATFLRSDWSNWITRRIKSAKKKG